MLEQLDILLCFLQEYYNEVSSIWHQKYKNNLFNMIKYKIKDIPVYPEILENVYVYRNFFCR